MSIRSFGKAIDESEDYVEERRVIDTVEIAGVDVALYEPTAGQAAYLALAFANVETANDLSAVGQVINLLANCMDDDGQRHFRRALVDPRAELGPEDFLGLARIIMEETSGNPTTAPSGSSGRRSGTGRSSTATSRRAPSTRSGTSRSTGS